MKPTMERHDALTRTHPADASRAVSDAEFRSVCFVSDHNSGIIMSVASSPVSTTVPSFRLTEPPMSQETSISRRQVEILNAFGLHMRPAQKFVKLAEGFQAEIKVLNGDRVCNGKSIMDMMTLGAPQGARIELEACGPDADDALSALAQLVAARFHETDEGFAVDPAT